MLTWGRGHDALDFVVPDVVEFKFSVLGFPSVDERVM